MKSVTDAIEETGAEKTNIGMPHRGRLDILANVVRKPAEIIFANFKRVMFYKIILKLRNIYRRNISQPISFKMSESRCT